MLGLLLLAVAPAFADQRQDLRILIDSSDSVSSATTTLNLADSLEMFVQLLPESSRAGICWCCVIDGRQACSVQLADDQCQRVTQTVD
jgi:hypothetical protein